MGFFRRKMRRKNEDTPEGYYILCVIVIYIKSLGHKGQGDRGRGERIEIN